MPPDQQWYKVQILTTVAIRAPTPEKAWEIADGLTGADDWAGWHVLKEEPTLNEPEEIPKPLQATVGLDAMPEGGEGSLEAHEP